MGFELIYRIYIGGYYVLVGFNLEKCGNLGKTAIFSVRYGRIGDMQHGRIWPDWGYATWADMAGLGSKGITCSGLGALSAKLEYLPN